MKSSSARAERILVKEVNWLGDVVMSLPALKALRGAFPGAHLGVLVKHELASFFDGSRWIDEVIPYRVSAGLRGLADRWGIVSALRARRFDLALLFPKSFEAAFWAALAGARRRVGFATDGRGLMLTDRIRFDSGLRRRHQVNDYLHLLAATLGVTGDATDCAPDVDSSHRSRMADWLAERRRMPAGKLVALAVAAAYGPAKEWPAERYAALADLLAARHGAECVLVGGPGERDKCARVAAASSARPLAAAGETNVGELLALLSLCDGFAGNDSGAMHVAGALGIPTVGIFGSTDARRTGPLGPRTRVLHHPIECSPCLKRTCRYGHYDCLKKIDVEEVAAALVDLGTLADER
jgi:heptosyltransferase-2